MQNLDYDRFIDSKSKTVKPSGFDAYDFALPLFDWQKSVVKWALKSGKSALFEDCGLGKTIQQLEWARQVAYHTQMPVLILTPLSVARQTKAEAKKFGMDCVIIENSNGLTGPIVCISNYEKIENIDESVFSGIVLDESSILKSFTGKTRKTLTSKFSKTPFRLCCTATPSPNDYTELGQHADFLGVCSFAQMLATFFINDTFNTGDSRLKKHAEKEFWNWLASWACCISKPSDIGFSDEGYDLPGLNMNEVIVMVDDSDKSGSELFKHVSLSATTMHAEMRETSLDRSKAVSELVNASTECWIVWCNTNDAADHLTKLIPDAVEVRGSDSSKKKESDIDSFMNGTTRVLITKSSIAGYGLNMQHCCNVAFVGLSYSFEDFYQALRRTYRFGQSKIVNAYIVQAHTEGAILKSINQKISQHKIMQQEMKKASSVFIENRIKELTAKTSVDLHEGDGWKVYHGDCVRVAKMIPDNSIDFSVFSPPFADLFTYSDDVQDMGNCDNTSQFIDHFEHLIAELHRIMVPGREVAVHCLDLLSTKWKTGEIQFQDFSGEIIRAFWRNGFTFHSRICIWKSPVTEMQRTKAHGLLYKTLRTDSSCSRVGSADYLLIFRKKGENPRPITKDPGKYPVEWWQEVASPVWMTVDQGRVLNRDGARDNNDERHISPLQLDVIERAIELWSNEGDLVYSPFTGIGSEGVGALTLGRRFVGSELKESYVNQSVLNLNNSTKQSTLF
jgi:DNA modification methylase